MTLLFHSYPHKRFLQCAKQALNADVQYTGKKLYYTQMYSNEKTVNPLRAETAT